MDNIRRRIVGVMFPPSIFDASTFEDRCVDFRRSRSCRPSEIDVLTFEDRCVDLRRSLMCRPSKIDSRCVDLRTSMVDVKLGCYTCSKY